MFSGLGNFISVLQNYIFDGDQNSISSDTSKFRTGTCSVVGSDIYNLLIADGVSAANALGMFYESHNIPISKAGKFGPVDDPGPAFIRIITEGHQDRIYNYAGATIGVAPTVANFGVATTFIDYASGNITVAPATAAAHAVQASQTPLKNLIVNPYFTVNNGNAGTAYVSAATLAAGTYGHEMWKAGASGGDYSFTQNIADTTITIAANKTLIQTIPPENLGTTSYVLSWTGTALARAAVNAISPAGSFAASPIIITGQTVGTAGLCIEFGNGASTGTLGDVALINGSVPMAAARKTSQEVLFETQRYAIMVNATGTAFTASAGVAYINQLWMRATPSLSGITIFIENVGIATLPTVANTNYSTSNFLRMQLAWTSSATIGYSVFATTFLISRF